MVHSGSTVVGADRAPSIARSTATTARDQHRAVKAVMSSQQPGKQGPHLRAPPGGDHT